MLMRFAKFIAVVIFGYVLVIGAFLIVIGLITAARADWSPDAMNRQIDATNFLVNDNCSATLVGSDVGYLLTASHCIQSQFRTIEREKIDDKGVVTKEQVRISVPGTVSQLVFSGPDEIQRTSYTFKIVQNDSDLDLALIKINAKLPTLTAAPIACREAERGETVYAVGNSLGVLYASVSKGIVASTHRNYRMIGVDGSQAENGLIQATAPTAGGNSGGALYNDGGEIVGVVVRGYQQVAPINLSVPLGDVKKFLSREKLERLWSRCEATK